MYCLATRKLYLSAATELKWPPKLSLEWQCRFLCCVFISTRVKYVERHSSSQWKSSRQRVFTNSFSYLFHSSFNGEAMKTLLQFLGFIIAVSALEEPKLATVLWSKSHGFQMVDGKLMKSGDEGYEAVAAWGNFTNEVNSTGWSYLEISTNDKMPDKIQVNFVYFVHLIFNRSFTSKYCTYSLNMENVLVI